MAWIISQPSASCGPSHMIATFHESSWGTTEMARSVGHSLMSSISSLMAASSSSRVFAGFFKCPSLSGAGETGPPPLAIRYRRRPQTAGGGPTSQRLCLDNVPTACYFAGGTQGAVGGKVHLLAFLMPSPSHRPSSASSWITCLYPDFSHQEHGAIRFAIAPAGLWIRRPPIFDGNLFPSRPSKVGSEESADATGPVT